ncbi:hypothetical protein [Saliterribacillus persicus]|uniref:Uncharacterized protein n=1 Tax=Saliterribacillus persicus TaxID=930114 RepID=A0A368XVL4_9BACI|nr:hypothetical protein [Saliterribacillus persicus]RCW72031.1 hypothetical protein DFR57_105216 [Saliterribacillus persicus]
MDILFGFFSILFLAGITLILVPFYLGKKDTARLNGFTGYLNEVYQTNLVLRSKFTKR